MRFKVKHIHKNKNFWDFSGNPTFTGEGYVFLQDNALIIEGNIPKFDISFMFNIYQQVIFVPTIRTVPYSVILKYKKPRFGNGKHQIIYRLPNGKKDYILFEMTKPKKQNDTSFSVKFEDYINTTKSFLDN